MEVDSLTVVCLVGMEREREPPPSRSGQILRLRDVEFARFPLIESLSRPDYTGSRGNKPLRGSPYQRPAFCNRIPPPP